MLKAVILDLDDTLYPEISYVKSGFRAAAAFIKKETGAVGAYAKLMRLFNGDRQKVFDRYCAAEGLPDGMAKRMHDIYVAHEPGIKPYPDALEFLSECKRRNIKLGLVTDGRPGQQNAKIDALKICGCFDKIIITDELGGVEYRKPCPRAFELMRGAFAAGGGETRKVEYGEIVYIGDNDAKDFTAPNLLGMATVKIIRPDSLYAGASGGTPAKYEVKDLKEIFGLDFSAPLNAPVETTFLRGKRTYP